MMFRFQIFSLFLILTAGSYAQKMDFSLNNDSSIRIIECDDYIHFTFNTNILLKKDTEQFRPVEFEILLPNKIKYWEVINGSNFGFYYRNKQVIFISTRFLDNQVSNDTVFIPSKNEMEDIIDNDFYTSGNSKWDIKNIDLLDARRNLLIKKGKCSILLLNIRNKSFKDYRDNVLTFRLLNE